MKKGLLIVYSGPSGVGKGTVLNELFKYKELNLCYSVSMTTRKPRSGEINGLNYFFVSEERFKEAINNDELLEYAHFVGNYYGTPKDYVEKCRNEGKNVILEIEVEGAKQVLDKNQDALSIFLIPPSLEELESRIRNRKTEDESTIIKRIEKGKKEMPVKDTYKYVVCNEDIKNAAKEIRDIILKNL